LRNHNAAARGNALLCLVGFDLLEVEVNPGPQHWQMQIAKLSNTSEKMQSNTCVATPGSAEHAN
jgi:hypothetical protein